MTPSTAIFASDALPIVPPIVWLGCGFGIFLISLIFTAFLKRSSNFENKQSAPKVVLLFLEKALIKPLLLFLVGYAVYAAGYAFVNYFPALPENTKQLAYQFTVYVEKVSEFFAFFWALLNILNDGQALLQLWLIKNNKRVFNILLPMISKSLKAAMLLLMLNVLIPALGFNGLTDMFVAKLAKVALISIIAWLFIQLIYGVENLILNQYSQDDNNQLFIRRVSTQVLMLRKVIVLIVSVVAVASILIVFDSVKNLGAGILTTAGLLSALGAFASQQSLGRIFAGLQIAFTQPIRIGDTVIIDNEQGQVEEITLSYIVVKLWDLRRMIVPSDYFTNRGLQNLSRTSTELLGTVFFYTDYMLPVDVIRAKFYEIIKQSALWNGKVSNFQVTEIKESSMELRALVSAKDAATLWDLRCEIREKLMQFIIETYPQYLSKRRNITSKNDLFEQIETPATS
jgi:small-conductance mechanosensitive channel